MSSQQTPPPPPKKFLFCTSENIVQNFTTAQPFPYISNGDLRKLMEQGNATWNDVCEKSVLRNFGPEPPAPPSTVVDDNDLSNPQTNEDLSTELNNLEDDQLMDTDWPINNSELEQEVVTLKQENKKLCSFYGKLQTCLGVDWNTNEYQIISELNLQMTLDQIKQLMQNGEEDKLELEKLKVLKLPINLEEKIMIDQDSQTTEKFAGCVVTPKHLPRRKKGVCKVVGTDLQEYWCSCGRAFANRDRIAAHIKINKLSWKFRCTECTLKFADLKTLKAHMETEHKIKNPIEVFNRGCIFCGKMFESADELSQHTENQ